MTEEISDYICTDFKRPIVCLMFVIEFSFIFIITFIEQTFDTNKNYYYMANFILMIAFSIQQIMLCITLNKSNLIFYNQEQQSNDFYNIIKNKLTYTKYESFIENYHYKNIYTNNKLNFIAYIVSNDTKLNQSAVSLKNVYQTITKTFKYEFENILQKLMLLENINRIKNELLNNLYKETIYDKFNIDNYITAFYYAQYYIYLNRTKIVINWNEFSFLFFWNNVKINTPFIGQINNFYLFDNFIIVKQNHTYTVFSLIDNIILFQINFNNGFVQSVVFSNAQIIIKN